MCVDHRGAGSRTRVRVRRRVLKRKPRCRGIGLRSSLRRTPGTPAEPLSGSVLRKEGSNRFDRPGHWSGIPTYGAGRTIQVTEPVMKIRSLDHRDQNEPWGTKVRGCESRDSCTLAPLNPGPTGSFWPSYSMTNASGDVQVFLGIGNSGRWQGWFPILTIAIVRRSSAYPWWGAPQRCPLPFGRCAKLVKDPIDYTCACPVVR